MIPYLVWSLILLIGFPLIKKDGVPWGEIPYKMLTGGASGPYYFILLIIQLYLLTPILLKIRTFGARGAVFIVFINLMALGGLYLSRFMFHSGNQFELFALPFYSWIVFYYFGLCASQSPRAGTWLSATHKGWIVAFVIFLIMACGEAVWIIRETGEISAALSAMKFSSFACSFALIAAFLGGKDRIKTNPKMLRVLGDYSFGIYLIHMIFLSPFITRVYSVKSLNGFPLLLSMGAVVITTLICMGGVYGARKLFGKKISTRVLGL